MININFNIYNIPFSRYGAYVALTGDKSKKQLTVHNARRRCGEDETFEAEILENGNLCNYELSASPDAVTVKCDTGEVKIYVRDDNTLVFVSTGPDLRFTLKSNFGYGVDQGDGQYEMISVQHHLYTRLFVKQGFGLLEGPFYDGHDFKWNNTPVDIKKTLYVKCESGTSIVALQMTPDETIRVDGDIDPERDIAAIRTEWNDFFAALPPIPDTVPDVEREYAAITWYNMWSSFARAEDVYAKDTMLMSKKYMSSVWSWDHCFNALAVASISKERALDQFMAPFHLQLESGSLPDMWNPHQEVIRGVTKPPIHGWCFDKLMDRFDFTDEELQKVYHHLEKWTLWWMEYRDSDKDGIPEYPMGCDSGWDNSTVFDMGYFVESPDLSAFLVLQMRTLSRIAGQILNGQDIYWSERADGLLQKLYGHLWVGEHFIAKKSGSHEYQENPTSLLVHIPIVLGALLDYEKAEKIAHILKNDHLTEHGLATEQVNSPRYQPDGYWRGPIWAPPTYLVVDGLRRAGFKELAREIAEKYIKMSCHVAQGNYENFDAVTGAGLRAPGYTWSASVYMLLFWEYRCDKVLA